MIDLYTKDWNLDGIETMLFDKDGTFIDSHIYWGGIIEKRINAVIAFYNIQKTDAFETLCLSLGYDCGKKCLIPEGPIALLAREEVIDSLTNALQKYDISAKTKDIEEIFVKVHSEFINDIFDYVEMIEDAKDLFERLKEKNVTLAVVTSDTFANTEVIVEHLGLSKYFDLIIGKDNCTQAKKTGEPAIVAMEKLGANPKTTISIGDAPMDSDMAKNAGLKGSILVSTGQIPIEDLKEHSPYCVKSLRDVIIKK